MFTSNNLVLLAVGAVAIVLVMGLANMLRAGSSSLSQNMMRWRVGLQFVAIVIILLVLYFRS